MPIGRYVAWVGTALLALLFGANWFSSHSLAEPAAQEINRPVILIASIQQPLERIVIDTNLPTIVLPPTLSAGDATDEPPQQVQSHPSATFRNPVADAEKRKPEADRARVAFESHLSRARWMTEQVIAICFEAARDHRDACLCL